MLWSRLAQQSPSLSIGRQSRVVLVGSGRVLLCPVAAVLVRNRVGPPNASRTHQSQNHRRREGILYGRTPPTPIVRNHDWDFRRTDPIEVDRDTHTMTHK